MDGGNMMLKEIGIISALRKYRMLSGAGVICVILISSSLACAPKSLSPSTPSSSSSPPTIRYGNTVGNLANDGLVAQQGEWIYYSNELDDDKLYKIRTDGTQKQKICDDQARYLNVLDDWIYYVKDYGTLFKIRIDGTKKIQISKEKESVGDINVVGNWIYYVAFNLSDEKYLESISKIRTNGTRRQQLYQTHELHNLIVVGNWIYFQKWGNYYNIYKMKTDGTQVQALNQEVSFDINVVDDWIYYSEDVNEKSKLCKMKTDGTQKQYLNQDGCDCLNVVGDWIYFVDPNDNRYLYKIRTDGTQKQLLSNDRSWGLNIADDWIYYSVDLEGSHAYYKIRTDGTDKQLIGTTED